MLLTEAQNVDILTYMTVGIFHVDS